MQYDAKQWPLPGTFDPIAITGSCAQTLLNSIPFSTASNVKVFNVLDGLGSMCWNSVNGNIATDNSTDIQIYTKMLTL